jgi:Fur family ferric uptake transcriptional regulator
MERNTRQRDAVRGTLASKRSPMSAAEIHRAAARRVPGIGLATVYRTLKALLEAKEIVPVALPGDTPRYELATLGHHHHFHCRVCGRVFEIEGCPANLSRLAPRGFAVDGHELVLYGRCTGCAA